MSSLSNRFIFPLASWRGATFSQKRLRADDIQVIFKQMRASGYKFVQKVVVKPYEERSKASAEQAAARNRFSTAWANTDIVLADATQRAEAEADFAKQFKYSTLRGFVFAREYAKLEPTP